MLYDRHHRLWSPDLQWRPARNLLTINIEQLLWGVIRWNKVGHQRQKEEFLLQLKSFGSIKLVPLLFLTPMPYSGWTSTFKKLDIISEWSTWIRLIPINPFCINADYFDIDNFCPIGSHRTEQFHRFNKLFGYKSGSLPVAITGFVWSYRTFLLFCCFFYFFFISPQGGPSILWMVKLPKRLEMKWNEIVIIKYIKMWKLLKF